MAIEVGHIKLIVNLFLRTKANDLELHKRTGFSLEEIREILTSEELVKKGFPLNGEELYKEIEKYYDKDRVYVIEKEKTIYNSGLDIDSLFQKEVNMKKFLLQCALTFRMKLPLLSELLNSPEDVIYNEMIRNSDNIFLALLFLFNSDTTDQIKAKEQFLSFYDSFKEAIKNRDTKKRKELLGIICDEKAHLLSKTRKEGDKISESDLETMLSYQLKYSLTAKDVSDYFNISLHHYVKIVNEYLSAHPEEKLNYEILVDIHKNNKFNRRG